MAKEGTWLAGQDGPPGMIMPADPMVGDVYRPENIPGLVLEEVTVKATDKTVKGPRGEVSGAILIQECLMDGTLDDKQFAPGYGEFKARVKAKDERYQVALAVPLDSLREAQLRLDRQTGDPAAVARDEVTIESIRDRIR